jgi:hypothetical protein
MPMREFRAKGVLGTLIFLCGCAFALTACATASNPEATPGAIHQLRIYEIFEGNKAAFHQRFREHALRVMRKYDFDIVSMWESTSGQRTEFVYLLRWPDERVMKEQWTKFMADQEWAEIKKRSAADHGALVGEIQDRVLRLTDYSPTELR